MHQDLSTPSSTSTATVPSSSASPGLIVDRPAGWPERVAVLAAALGLWVAAKDLLNPRLSKAIWPQVRDWGAGPQLLLGHLLVYSLLPAAACVALHAALVGSGRFSRFRWDDPARSLKLGFVGGVAISVATATLWAIMHGSFFVDVNVWKMVGNLFSNFYEEVIYRGLILAAALYCLRERRLALIVAGLAFGLSHSQYPLWLQLFVAAIGVSLGWMYLRTGNLLAPWLAHQVSDMLLDTFLKG